MEMSVTDLVAADESDKFDLNGTTLLHSATFCKVSFKDIY